LEYSAVVEKITELIDNKIKDTQEIQYIESIICKNENLYLEYVIQTKIKKILSDKFSNTIAPAYLQKRIYNKLLIEQTSIANSSTLYNTVKLQF